MVEWTDGWVDGWTLYSHTLVFGLVCANSIGFNRVYISLRFAATALCYNTLILHTIYYCMLR